MKDGSLDTVRNWMQRHRRMPSRRPILHSVSRTRDSTNISWVYSNEVKDYIPNLATMVETEIREELPSSLAQRCILRNSDDYINIRPLRVQNGAPRPETQGVLKYLQLSKQGSQNSTQHVTLFSSVPQLSTRRTTTSYAGAVRPPRPPPPPTVPQAQSSENPQSDMDSAPAPSVKKPPLMKQEQRVSSHT
jgi:hypothetical protein